jgi:hypothetical protein
MEYRSTFDVFFSIVLLFGEKIVDIYIYTSLIL